ncbi:MAG: acyl-[ACP]--phospholipid O-acyltransferase [Rickettsiales bacterium]|nr:MAG: acyl-[ACP]--phospholipid O-acyltransferase [Rickettsiales bacterium]
MASNQLYLFKDKRFLPIFLVQFCGCLNDSILKNALIILITFKLANDLDTPVYLLIMLANIIFILPFVLFASLAGQVADRYERTVIVKIIKAAEIGIILLSAYGFYITSLPVLFFCLALMGIHSTFFGPIKYSVLPDQMHKDELLGANGYIEAGTFLSILFGTMLGGFYNFNNNLILILIFSIAIIGFISAFYMPKSNNSNDQIKIKFNLIKENIKMVKYASSKKQVYLAILGISWFWFIGAAIMAQIPSLTRDILKADENVANLFLATFSIGVGVGSFWCNKIFANKITTKYVFLAALGISVFGADLYFASKIAASSYEPEQLKTVWQFLQKKHYWRILVDLFLLAAIGGLYVVPLFAVMQYFSSPIYRSRIIATNNLINSFFMAGSTAILSLLFYMDFSIPSVILVVSLLNMVIAIYIYQLIPNSHIIPRRVWKMIFKCFFTLFYNIEVRGIENYKKAGKRTVIVANHLSYLDPALIGSYVPDNIQFAINMTVAKEWWVRPFLKIVKTYPIEPNNPMAVKSLIEEVRRDKKIAIFPEGRTSATGSLMKVYEGPGMIADKADATILPIRVDGTQYTIFAKVRKLMRGRFALRRKITITMLPPVKVNPPAHLDNRQRRKFIGQELYNIMSEMIFESSNYQETIFQSLINAANIHGKKTFIMQDIDNNSTTYKGVILKAFIMANLIAKNSPTCKRVGLMLPNMVGSIITFFGVQASGRIPAMINFTAGPGNIISACNTAQIKTIYTSKKFIEKAELHNLISALKEAGIKLIYLENLRKQVSIFLKIKCLIASIFSNSYYKKICHNSNDLDTAVILFTSGTEGKPKAVALSHRNIQANRCQILARIDFNPYDCAFNALPIFHTFGLTATLLMCLNGVRTFFYPSPLHYRIIPEIIYDIGATIMFSADTFLSGYAAYAHPYDFYSLRYVVAGAEKLKEKTRQTWFNKFGIRIFEGYGVTEAAPVIAFNTPMHDKPGSVGRLIPKIEYHLQPVDGIEQGGRLCVKGPNIMQGYIMSDNPGVIIPPYIEKLGNGWYDTGDIVSVDNDGFITILGREKRFAKVAGEMISLAAVEDLVTNIDKESMHAAVSIEDETKGEQILLFTTNNNMQRDAITKSCQLKQLSEMYVPKIIISIPEIPILATGKLNYRKLVEMAREYVNNKNK